jgi:iron complex outermembrane receptor protein
MDDSKDVSDRLSLGSSLRFDDYDGFGGSYTGALQARYGLTQANSFQAGVSRHIRIPSFTELFYNDPVTRGDAGLAPEESLNYQVGWDYRKEAFSVGLAPFFRQEKDMIDWIKLTPDQPKFQVQNITRDEAFGAETYVKFAINKYSALDSNYSFIDKVVKSRGYIYKYGQNYTRHLVNTQLSFRLPFGIQALGLAFKKKPDRPGWYLVSSHFSCDLSKRAQFFLDVTNLFNVKYEEIVGIPQPGRSIEGGIRFDW